MNYDYDVYAGRVVANAPDTVRAEFISKVYRLFLLSVLVTVGSGWFCAQPTVLPAILPMLGGVAILTFVVGIVMAFTQRVPGLNVLMLLLFSALEGAIVGPVLMMVERSAPGVGANAAYLTIAVFTGLTLYTFASKKDFSFLGGFLWTGLLCLVFAGILMIFLPSAAGSLLYSVAGVVLFSGYILYDTSNIMRRLGPDEAVAGAIGLYLDLVNLFWFILRLLQSSRD
jgi:FtsH-binding integral membrane protein